MSNYTLRPLTGLIDPATNSVVGLLDGLGKEQIGLGSGAWGAITGALAAQTDLNTALGLKANAAAAVLTGIVTHAGADLIVGNEQVGRQRPCVSGR